MLLSSAANNAAVVFKGSASTPGTATLGGIWYIKGVATDTNGIELVLDDRRNEQEADLSGDLGAGKKAPLHTLRQKYAELSTLSTAIDESDAQCREAIQTAEDAQDTRKLSELVKQLVCLGQLKVAGTRGKEKKTLDEWLDADTNNATTSTQEHTPTNTEAKQDTDTPTNHRDKGHARGTLKQHTTATKGHTS
ncbi:hypothetical protein ERJ75_000915200 [Trypanosoma vivax]|nr:hypothetical protein ERJ75_000915200 [Trypanosoma vivax]